MTQEEFNQMLAVAIAEGLGGGTYISKYSGEEIDAAVGSGAKGPIIKNGTWWTWDVDHYVDTGVAATAQLTDGAVTTPKLADGAVTWPKLAPEARKSNPNLLDNWYFVGGGSQQGGGQFPINQRGLTEYTSIGYAIDRWIIGMAEGISHTKLTLTANGICILPGNYVRQLFENIWFDGKEVTFSALINDNLLSFTFIWNSSTPYSTSPVSNGWTISYSGTSKYVHIYNVSGQSNDVIRAVKLELGSHQTLAYESAGGGGS